MKRLYAGESLDVEALRSLMETDGIEVAVLNEALGGLVGGIPFTATLPELWIGRDEDEPRAVALIERYFADKAKRRKERDPRRDPEAKCQKCGYLLYKLPKRRCPECGTKF